MPESKCRKRNDNIHKNEFAGGDFPETKIIAISGGGQTGPQDHLVMACRLGADAAMEKPFGSKELLNTVKEPLRK